MLGNNDMCQFVVRQVQNDPGKLNLSFSLSFIIIIP